VKGVLRESIILNEAQGVNRKLYLDSRSRGFLISKVSNRYFVELLTNELHEGERYMSNGYDTVVSSTRAKPSQEGQSQFQKRDDETPQKGPDILVIAALGEELEAFRKIKFETINTDLYTEDSVGKWIQKQVGGITYWERILSPFGFDERTIVCATPGEPGGEGTAAIASILAIHLKPQRIAMVGICAGNKDSGLCLGDVVVVESLFRLSPARISRDSGGVASSKRSSDCHYPLPNSWKTRADTMSREENSRARLAELIGQEKPLGFESQSLWLLNYINEMNRSIGDPFPPTKNSNCLNYDFVLGKIRKKGWLESSTKLVLTDDGRKQLENQCYRDKAAQMKKSQGENPKIHIGKVGVSASVMEDDDLFGVMDIDKPLAIEMEGGGLCAATKFLGIKEVIMVKAVADYGDTEKELNRPIFREYALRASSGFLVSLLHDVWFK
jgi:nucleoside phosphorylase